MLFSLLCFESKEKFEKTHDIRQLQESCLVVYMNKNGTYHVVKSRHFHSRKNADLTREEFNKLIWKTAAEVEKKNQLPKRAKKYKGLRVKTEYGPGTVLGPSGFGMVDVINDDGWTFTLSLHAIRLIDDIVYEWRCFMDGEKEIL